MTTTRIPKQKLATLVDFKSIVAAYNKSVSGRLMLDAMISFVNLEGFDALKTLCGDVSDAIDAVATNPYKMAATGQLNMQTPKVGVAVTVVPSQWDGLPQPALTYQWKKDGTNISGATSASYTPVSGDATHTLSVTVTATNTGGSGSETISAANATAA